LPREGKEPIVKETKTDSEGNWFLVFDQRLEKGKWQISGQIFDKRGAQSPETEKIPLKVVSPSFVKKYSTLDFDFALNNHCHFDFLQHSAKEKV
jgi:hypothetical protein